MAKTRKYLKGYTKPMKILKKTSKVAARGVKKVGDVTKNVITLSSPIVEKGVSKVYSTLETGFDLGVKGISKMTKRKRSNRKSRRY